MNTAAKAPRRLTLSTLALASGLAIGTVSGGAFAQPSSEVYAYAVTQAATGLAAGRRPSYAASAAGHLPPAAGAARP